MNRIILALSLAAAASPATAAERRYSVTDFDRVQVDGPYEVRLVSGGPSSASASGDPRALDNISVEVQGRVLRIRPNRSGWAGSRGEPAGPVSLTVGTRNLRAVSLRGSGSLTVDDIEAMRLDLTLTGSGRIEIGRIEADNLIVSLLGSGRMVLAGEAKQLRAAVQGAGDLDAASLQTQDARLTADTAGTIALTASRTAQVTATGQGDVRIDGGPSCTLSGPAAARVSC